MQVKYKRAFIKDVKQLPPEIREGVERLSLYEIPKLKDITEIKNLKKIKLLESVTAKSRLTESDVDDLDHEIKAALSKR